MIIRKISRKDVEEGDNKGFIIIFTAISVLFLLFSLYPGIEKYIRQSKTAEAGLNLRIIYDLEVTYYEELAIEGKIPQFVSAPQTPPGMPGKDKRTGNWDQPGWKALKFMPDKPVRYSYTASASGTGTNATFTISAIGDLNGDGKTSLFQRGATSEPWPGEGPGLYMVNDLE